MSLLNLVANLFLALLAIAFLLVIIVFIRDRSQRSDAILHNYPVIGHFRYIFSKLGEFFRQYFFAMDREELPFNRAQRDWVKRASNNEGINVAFGSTQNLTIAGSRIFVNAPYPKQDEEAHHPSSITFGAGFCKYPYTSSALINISGMSYGALSKPAIRALSSGAKMANCYLNTGEGGLSPYHLEGGNDVVFQMGTAKYGARDSEGNFNPKKLKEIAAKNQVKMIELKLAQGAKPGKGGILPAEKVTPEIAQIRGIPADNPSISPNRHPEIKNNRELLTFIRQIREITDKPCGFKTVISDIEWIQDLCQTINQLGLDYAPDFITVDGGDGGTGAAPMTLMDNVGLPITESLPMLVDCLISYQLKDRIKVIASGKLINPSDIAWAYCAGADTINVARGFMFSLGCIQALKCNKNSCPTGITTHNPKLQQGLDPQDKSVKVANYAKQIHYAVGIIAHSCGVSEARELRRNHVRLVQHNGHSIRMDQILPEMRPPSEIRY